MKKNTFYSNAVLAAVFLVLSWVQLGGGPVGLEAEATFLRTHIPEDGPDYPMDGQVYYDSFLRISVTSLVLENPDNSADAEVLHDLFMRTTNSKSDLVIPDYPADGKVF
ncbi:MAG: hypothetical protein GTO18_00910 [Anaerolineales bacterium]|nr:hypothetical protein [Anaerolineales bacterium]